MSGPFQDRALGLFHAGHRVVPIPRGTKGALIKGWTELADTEDEATVLDLIRGANGCGVGILAKWTAGVDIDVRDPDLAQRLAGLAETMLGSSCQRIGEAPKVLLPYRVEVPFTKITSREFRIPGDQPGDKPHKIEILGDGQQWVAFHTHPDTGKPYHWPDGDLPAREDLPEITAEAGRRFVDAAEAMILQAGGKIATDRLDTGNGHLHGQASDFGLVGTYEAVADALRCIPNADCSYDDWIRICFAIKGALGEDGRDLFDGWSELSTKHDPDTTPKAWASAKPKTAGAGTIYHLARERGWKPGPEISLNPEKAEERAERERQKAYREGYQAGFEDAQERERDEDHGSAHTAGDETTSPPKRPALVWADDIQIDLAESGVIDGFQPRTGIGVMYGESGSGKTFVAIDQACHVAAGLPWRGMAVEQGIVVYIASESPESVKRRVWAWKRHHVVEHLPLVIVQVQVDLLNGSAAELAELVAKITSDRGRVAMVVVDTLARAMTGNENSPDDMGAFVAAVAGIVATGDTFGLIVHHSGKDTAKGARGHSSLRAATDHEQEITAGCIKITKTRDDEGNARFGFHLHRVELGTNSKGRVVSTCVALEAAPPAKAAATPEMSDRQKLILDSLAAAIVDYGDVPPAALDIPGKVRVVALTKWCEVALRYLPDDKPDFRRREAFHRTVEALQVKGFVRVVDGWCWPCR